MKKVFKPLIEKASPNDSFKHKTHERIATTLSNLLINNKGEGQTIGLEGVWGSGKSTVIAILKDKLPQNDFTYFYFDAWAHEGDPLRRVFLESLINSIDDKDERLKELGNRISNRKKNIKTRTFRQATWFGKLLSISLFFVPFGAAVISTLDFSEITFKSGNTWCWELIIGTIFTLAPFIVILGNIIQLWRSKDANINERRNWSFLEDNSDTDITQEVSEDEEKSSIEFEKYFEEIIEIAFNGQTEKQLVAIVDNLDRIDAQDSLKIWSTLQTFLKQRNPDTNAIDINKNIWIIVPYDAIGLAKLWDSSHINDQVGSEDSAELISDRKCADSFFDKCFQIRLEVPKPILSDWEDFTLQMIETAFGKKFKYKNEILNVIRITRNNISDTLTPREIKTYVNQVGINWLNCDNDIPIESVAYYVVLRYLNKTKVIEVQQGLVSGDIPVKEHKSFLPSTIIEDLAGLSFGVSSEIGQQLLLEPELVKNLKTYAEGKLEELSNIHENGFWFVYSYHLERVATEEAFLYSNAVYKGLWEKYQAKSKSFIKALDKKTFKLSSFDDTDNHIGFIEVFKSSSKSCKYYWDSVITYLRELFKEKLDNIESIILLLPEVIKRIPVSELTKATIKTEHLDTWKTWSKQNYEIGLDLYEWIIPEEVHFNNLSQQVQAGARIPDGVFETTIYFFKANPHNWASMVEACKQHIFWNNGTENKNRHSIEAIEILYTLCIDNDYHDDEIKVILKHGNLYNFLHHQSPNGIRIELVAVLFAKYFPDETNSLAVPAVVNSANGLQLIRNFWASREDRNISTIEESIGNDIDLIWELAKVPQNKLIGEYISHSIDIEKKELFKVAGVLEKFRDANKLNEDKEEFDPKRLAQLFLNYSAFDSEIKNISKEVVIEYAKELTIFSGLLSDLQSITNHIERLEKSDWETGLSSDTHITPLALAIRSKDENFALTNNYYDALLDFAKSHVQEIESISDLQKSNWKKLIELLNPDFKRQFKNNLTLAYSEDLNLDDIKSLQFNADFLDLEMICNNNIIKIQSEIEASIKSEGKLSVLNNILFVIRSVKMKTEPGFKKVIKDPLNESWNSTINAEYKGVLEEVAKKLTIKLVPISNEDIES